MVVKPFLLTLISGLLFSASFKPFGLWFTAPIAFAILFYQLRDKSFPVIHALLFAFTANLIVLSWTNSFVGSAPWLLLVLLQSLYFLPLGIAAIYSRSVPLYIFIVLACEAIKARFPFGGFSWTKIAFSQVDSPFSPLVSTFGISTLTLATLLISYLLVMRSKIAGIFIALLIISAYTINIQPSSSGTISVRAIQGGVPQRGLDFNARAMQVLDNHIDATMQERDGTEDLIIWPENAIDIDPLRNKVVADKLAALATHTGTSLLAGAILDGERLFNSTILFNETGKPLTIYIKRYLTPFGEYIPLRSIARLVSNEADRVSDFSPGSEFITHDVKDARIASIICYEIINDGLVREAAKNSSLLVVHTNSATFSGSAEGEQQLAITRLRAMESQRVIVSVSTTGPSAIIDARGEVLQRFEDGEVGSLPAIVPLHNSKTISMRLGGYAELVILFSCGAWALLSKVRRGKR